MSAVGTLRVAGTTNTVDLADGAKPSSSSRSAVENEALSPLRDPDYFKLYRGDYFLFGKFFLNRQVITDIEGEKESNECQAVTLKRLLERTTDPLKPINQFIEHVVWASGNQPIQLVLMNEYGEDAKTRANFWPDEDRIYIYCWRDNFKLGHWTLRVKTFEHTTLLHELGHMFMYRSYGNKLPDFGGSNHIIKKTFSYSEPTRTSKTNTQHAWLEGFGEFVELSHYGYDLSQELSAGPGDDSIPILEVRENIRVPDRKSIENFVQWQLGTVPTETLMTWPQETLDYYLRTKRVATPDEIRFDSEASAGGFKWLNTSWKDKTANEDFVAIFLITMADNDTGKFDWRNFDHILSTISAAKSEWKGGLHSNFDEFLAHYIKRYPEEKKRIRGIAKSLVGLAPLPEWLLEKDIKALKG